MKKYLFILCLFFFAGPAYCQNFGAQFRDWVLVEAATDSRTLAKADYEVRVSHAISKIDETLIRHIQRADSVMYAVYTQIQLDEKALDGLDSLQAILQRARSARLAYYRLLEAENLLYFAAQLKTNLDSLGSNTYFYSTGLYHVGRETLLESYTSIGQQFADNFQLKYHNDYTIGVGATFNENGEATSASGEAGQPGMYTTIGTGIGAAIGSIAGGIGAVPGALIGGAVGGAVDYFVGSKKAKEQQEKAEKEFKKQMRLLEEGLNTLPGQLAPVDTLLGYYREYVNQFSRSNASIYQHIDSTLNLENLRFKEIFSYNVRRQQLSQHQLTADHIALIEKNFMSLEGLRNFYSNMNKVNYIRDCNLMVSRLTAEDNWLRTATVSRFDWLQRNEAYQDDLRFALLLVQQFLADESYLPYQSFLLQKKAELETKARNLPSLPTLAPLLNMKGFQAKTMAREAKAAERDAAEKHSGESFHLVIPQRLEAAPDRMGSFEMGICYGAGGYALCSGMNNDSYGGRFNNQGRSPVTDILGSSYDGGLRSFSATATRKIGAMREDIRERVKDLQNDYASLARVMPDAKDLYTRQATQVAISVGELGTLSAPEMLRFDQDFETSMPAVQQRLREFMNQPVRTGLTNLQRDLHLSQQIRDQIKPADIPTSVFRIGGTNFGYPSAPGQPAVALAWERELAKQGNALAAINRRVTDHTDPIFSNRRDFDAFKAKLGQVDQLLEHVNNDRHYGFEDRQRITAHYLEEAVKMRYAASGQLPASALTPTDYPFLESEQLDRLNGLANEFKQCDAEQDDCTSAYGHAIYQIYHNNSVTGLRNDEGQSFNAANLQQLATSSSEWEAVGPASSAGAVSQATLLAMSGNTVIATRPDGMDTRAGIVLPELPRPGTDGLWNGLPVPPMFYLDEDKPGRSFGRGLMSAVFPDPREVTFYTNRRPPSFNNLALTLQNKGIRPFAYSDPITGDRGTVPAIQFAVQTNTGGIAQVSEQTIPIAGDYVGRIVKQYGNNSRLVFENIYAHRDQLYGAYPADPSGLTAAESNRLRNLQQATGRFEDKERLLGKPEDLYNCQTSRCLYNSCITELSKADPLDRGKILDYYNQVEAALVKYHDDALNIGTMVTPGINDARDLYEFVTGKDLITGVLLSIWERGLSGAGLLIGSGSFYRQIDQLPMVRQNALDIARQGIPDFKLIQAGDLDYYVSKGGIYYERWNGQLGYDRFAKIVQEHYVNMTKSRFAVDDPNKIPAIIDEALKRAKDLHLVPTFGDRNNIRYIVEMDRPIGVKGERFINLVFDGNKGPGFFIITAFPSRTGKYPELP